MRFRLMIDLAQHDAGGYISAARYLQATADLAGHSEIVVQLSRAGFVISTQAHRGRLSSRRGILRRCARGRSAYYRWVFFAPVACLEHEPVDCLVMNALRSVFFGADCMTQSANYVDSVTLEDLVNNGTLNFFHLIAKR